MWHVVIGRAALKRLHKLPELVQQRFEVLLLDLEERGPLQPSWKNFSKLAAESFHCHLTYHYVACWRCERNTISIEVYYVGSRENAPYA